MTADAFDDIRRAVRRRFGEAATIENVIIPTLGGVNRTVVFDVVEGAARRRLVSRQETYAAESSPFLTMTDQFHAMRVVYKHGFPVPEPIFEYDEADASAHGYVTAFVEGETMPQRIFRAPGFAERRGSIAVQLGELLALLHSIDPSEVDFLARYPDSVDPIGASMRMFDLYAEAHPAIEIGLRWLERNRPPKPPPTLVHGDFRTGNFMVGPDGVKAILDWECPHIGSGIEDLGWLCTRSWRFGQIDYPVGGFGERAPFYAAYEAASGTKVDPEVVHYWEIFGLVRWAVYNVWQGYGHASGGRRGLVYAACGRNTCLVEYDLLMTLTGQYQ